VVEGPHIDAAEPACPLGLGKVSAFPCNGIEIGVEEQSRVFESGLFGIGAMDNLK
jgi:hypothetical protein